MSGLNSAVSAGVLTYRRQDGRLQGDQWHFGCFPIISEAFDFHRVELVLSISSQTNLQDTRRPFMNQTSTVE